eukprot:284816863_2
MPSMCYHAHSDALSIRSAATCKALQQLDPTPWVLPFKLVLMAWISASSPPSPSLSQWMLSSKFLKRGHCTSTSQLTQSVASWLLLFFPAKSLQPNCRTKQNHRIFRCLFSHLLGRSWERELQAGRHIRLMHRIMIGRLKRKLGVSYLSLPRTAVGWQKKWRTGAKELGRIAEILMCQPGISSLPCSLATFGKFHSTSAPSSVRGEMSLPSAVTSDCRMGSQRILPLSRVAGKGTSTTVLFSALMPSMCYHAHSDALSIRSAATCKALQQLDPTPWVLPFKLVLMAWISASSPPSPSLSQWMLSSKFLKRGHCTSTSQLTQSVASWLLLFFPAKSLQPNCRTKQNHRIFRCLFSHLLGRSWERELQAGRHIRLMHRIMIGRLKRKLGVSYLSLPRTAVGWQKKWRTGAKELGRIAEILMCQPGISSLPCSLATFGKFHSTSAPSSVRGEMSLPSAVTSDCRMGSQRILPLSLLPGRAFSSPRSPTGVGATQAAACQRCPSNPAAAGAGPSASGTARKKPLAGRVPVGFTKPADVCSGPDIPCGIALCLGMRAHGVLLLFLIWGCLSTGNAGRVVLIVLEIEKTMFPQDWKCSLPPGATKHLPLYVSTTCSSLTVKQSSERGPVWTASCHFKRLDSRCALLTASAPAQRTFLAGLSTQIKDGAMELLLYEPVQLQNDLPRYDEFLWSATQRFNCRCKPRFASIGYGDDINQPYHNRTHSILEPYHICPAPIPQIHFMERCCCSVFTTKRIGFKRRGRRNLLTAAGKQRAISYGEHTAGLKQPHIPGQARSCSRGAIALCNKIHSSMHRHWWHGGAHRRVSVRWIQIACEGFKLLLADQLDRTACYLCSIFPIRDCCCCCQWLCSLLPGCCESPTLWILRSTYQASLENKLREAVGRYSQRIILPASFYEIITCSGCSRTAAEYSKSSPKTL